MNQGKMWTVVNPSVGIPVFLGGVVLMALTVHYAVLVNSPWFAAHLNLGKIGVKTAANGSVAPVALATPDKTPGFAITVTPSAAEPGKPASFVVTVTPSGSTTTTTASVAVPDAQPHATGQLAFAGVK
jgi:light-harvesting protein B-800-850 alpha chain